MHYTFKGWHLLVLHVFKWYLKLVCGVPGQVVVLVIHILMLSCLFLEKTEKEQVTQVKCPHKIKNTPWISFRNNCYTFMITKNRWRELKSQEAHHLCRNMSKYFVILQVFMDLDQLEADEC